MNIHMRMVTRMTKHVNVARLRLINWLSPNFPVGAFGYSHGLEAAISANLVRDKSGLEAWLSCLVLQGSAKNDAILCAVSYQRTKDGENVAELFEIAAALASGEERYRETLDQGRAFADGVAIWSKREAEKQDAVQALPLVLGREAAIHGIDLDLVIAGFLNSFVSNLIQVAIRLNIIGQTQGIEVLACLEEVISQTTKSAISATLGDLASATVMSDLMSIEHETLQPRLFLS